MNKLAARCTAGVMALCAVMLGLLSLGIAHSNTVTQDQMICGVAAGIVAAWAGGLTGVEE